MLCLYTFQIVYTVYKSPNYHVKTRECYNVYGVYGILLLTYNCIMLVFYVREKYHSMLQERLQEGLKVIDVGLGIEFSLIQCI